MNDFLYYIDHQIVRAIPATPERKADSHLFFTTEAEALTVVKEMITADVNKKIKRLQEIEGRLVELAKENAK